MSRPGELFARFLHEANVDRPFALALSDSDILDFTKTARWGLTEHIVLTHYIRGKRDGGTAHRISISNFTGGGAEAEATLSQISQADWGCRRSNNYMSYAYLEKSLRDLKNYVFVGRCADPEAICCLFIYRFTGRDSQDATIVLLWTKETWRRKGFCTKIMHEGIRFLDNQAMMMGGTSTTPASRAVFRSQQWDGINVGIPAVLLNDLRKTLEQKHLEKGTGEHREWEVDIPSRVLEYYRARRQGSESNAPTDAARVLNNKDAHSAHPANRPTSTTRHQTEATSKCRREDASGKKLSSANAMTPAVSTNIDAIRNRFSLPRRLTRLEEEVFDPDFCQKAKICKLLVRVLNLEKEVGITPEAYVRLVDRVDALEDEIVTADRSVQPRQKTSAERSRSYVETNNNGQTVVETEMAAKRRRRVSPYPKSPVPLESPADPLGRCCTCRSNAVSHEIRLENVHGHLRP